MNNRKLRAHIADTSGNVIDVEWWVGDKADSHADAISILLSLYEKLVGEGPMPVSIEITSTFHTARS